ncbi:MAG: serine/threonine protein kinase [Acidobacteria bacterium]|nr:serine/threonine protein kinase [Acidobacteriota bacterium]MBI3472580.1 serine/threonine protein kinase [Candidatus Solibacter usitatus]
MQAGTRLGPYEIVAPLGAGGMGVVYRARDTRLNREVALKTLPDIFANDPEKMARFGREAQVLASLNHPHIASIYGLEESGGIRALAMELVEGPTLAERIAGGPVPLVEALPIARQIAEALEAAHEKGIIHRDLKPANVKLTRDGAVKVLDFGLAKALDGDPASSSADNSPTMSLAATRAGMILGTAAYTSPEQAKGKPVDRRADIWAFGRARGIADRPEDVRGRDGGRNAGLCHDLGSLDRLPGHGHPGHGPLALAALSRQRSQAPPAGYRRSAHRD